MCICVSIYISYMKCVYYIYKETPLLTWEKKQCVYFLCVSLQDFPPLRFSCCILCLASATWSPCSISAASASDRSSASTTSRSFRCPGTLSHVIIYVSTCWSSPTENRNWSILFKLPRPLISYLSKFYYYDPEEEVYLSIKSLRRAVRAEQEAESQT